MLSRVATLLLVTMVVCPAVAGAQPAVAGGLNYSVVLKADGTVATMGDNSLGQLGDGTSSSRRVPGDVPGLTGVTRIAAGTYHVLALKSDGTLVAWGYNAFGQIGDNSTTTRHAPVTIMTNVTAIAAGQLFSMALKSDGTVWTWGRNFEGQLGINNTTQSNVPIQVTTLPTIAAIDAGEAHGLAVTSVDGQVYTWGRNNAGQLGDNSTTTRLAPVLVSGLSNIVQVAGGDAHSLARTSLGAVYGWGQNTYGQVGEGPGSNRLTPIQISALSNIDAISAGSVHSIALKNDKSVWTWGNNGSGRLGSGGTTHRTTPAALLTPSFVVAIGAGDGFTLAIDMPSRVWTWGGNTNGQLGDGSTVDQETPVDISEADFAWRVGRPTFTPMPSSSHTANVTVTIASITPGATIRYTTNGAEPSTSDTVIASGSSLTLTAFTPLRAKAWKSGVTDSVVTTATYNFNALAPNYSPWGWANPALNAPLNVTIVPTTTGGETRYTTDGSEPTESSTLYPGSPITLTTTTTLKAKTFKAGWTTSPTQVSTYTFNYGPLAPPTASHAAGTHVGVQTVTLSAAPGATIRYALNNDILHNGSPVYTGPLTMPVTTTVKARAEKTDWTTSTVFTATYTIKVPAPVFSLPAGAYSPGQTVTITNPMTGTTTRFTISGIDPTSTDPLFQPGQTLTLGRYTLKAQATKANCADSDVASVAYTLTGPLTAAALVASDNHSFLLDSDGTLWAWGDNGSGVLGDGTMTQRRVPTRLATVTGIRSIASSASHTLVVQHDGTVMAWGANWAGQLGDGTTTGRSMPGLVPGLSSIVAVAVGTSHSLALTSDGRVYAWGYNNSGQLGDATNTTRSSPVEITTLPEILKIAGGDHHSLAIADDGGLFAWGRNDNGQLGDGTKTSRWTPTLITGVAGVVGASAGIAHSLALRTDGTVWAWGLNSSGQIGDGSQTERTSPVQVTALGGATRVEAGNYYSLAIGVNGFVWGWGTNADGQLGQESSASRLTPAPTAWASDVSAGASHTLALTLDRTLYAFGNNSYGQLGDGTLAMRKTPTPISDPALIWKVATPHLSPGEAVYTNAQTVTVTCVTPGASMFYTIDGSEPTNASTSIASGGTVAIDRTLRLRVRAFKSGVPASNIADALYTLRPLPPTISPAGGQSTAARTVTLSAGSGLSIYYTLDETEPTAQSTLYTGSFTLNSYTVVKAVVVKPNWTPSLVASATFTFSYGTLTAPTVSPAAGTYPEAQTVTLSASPGTTIRYSLDGTDVTTSSPIYTEPLLIATTTTLRARAFRTDYTTSSMTTAPYTITGVAPPAIAPPTGTYSSAQTVTMSTTTSGASIYYTLDGSQPTNASTLYTGSFQVTTTTTVKAKAYKTGVAASPVSTSVITLNYPAPVAPTFSPSAGLQVYGQGIVLSAAGGTDDPLHHRWHGTERIVTALRDATGADGGRDDQGARVPGGRPAERDVERGLHREGCAAVVLTGRRLLRAGTANHDRDDRPGRHHSLHDERRGTDHCRSGHLQRRGHRRRQLHAEGECDQERLHLERDDQRELSAHG